MPALFFKPELKFSDIITEFIIVIAVIICLCCLWKLYYVFGREKSWKVFLSGLALFALGSFLDLLDEFFRLPQIIPRVIENSCNSIGATLLAIGIVVSMRKIAVAVNRDSMTGLYNREYFRNALNIEIERSKRYHQTVAILFVDLDEFKNVNDTMGHTVGDMFLCRVADKVKQSIRVTDVAARYGGDEFVILMPETLKDEAEVVLKRIQQAMSELDLPGDIKIGVSGGISSYPADGGNIDMLISMADKRMYENMYDIF